MFKKRIAELKAKAQAEAKAAREIAECADRAGRDLTPGERQRFDAAMKAGADLIKQIKSAEDDVDIYEQAKAFAGEIGEPEGHRYDLNNGVRKRDGESVHETKAGRLQLTGAGVKSVARATTGKARETATAFGRKDLISSGTVTSVPVIGDVAVLGRPASLFDVLDTVKRDATYKYLRQTTRTNNAAAVAPGGTKPTSEYEIVPVDAKLETAAHVSEGMDKYMLLDAPNVEQFVASELEYGLRVAVEKLFLQGDGVSPNPLGILGTSGIQTQAFANGDELVAVMRKAITKLESLGHTASLFVLHPDDWETLELTRTSGTGELEFAGPIDRAARKLWGVQVVLSNELPDNTAVLLDTASVALGTDGTVETKWNEWSGFTTNELYARCETRINPEVLQPHGIVKIDTVEAEA